MASRPWIELRKERARTRILQMIPREPKKIRSKELFKKAKDEDISPNTVWKYIKIGMKNKSVRCIEVSPKKKYYQRTERADLELKLIDAIDDYRMVLNVIVPILNNEQKRLLLTGIKRNIKDSRDLLLQITGMSPEEIRDMLNERGTLKA